MNERESLNIISSAIDDASGREKIAKEGKYFLIWGLAVLLASLTQYGLIHSDYHQYHFMVWIFVSPLAATISFLYGENKGFYSTKHFGDSISQLWISFTVLTTTLVTMGLLTTRVELSWPTIYSMILFITSLATFFSGILLRFNPLKYGAVACFAFSIVSLYVSFDFTVLLLAASVICGFIIPGYLYNKNYAEKA